LCFFSDFLWQIYGILRKNPNLSALFCSPRAQMQPSKA
jgi:uncharacterized protein with PQ loop repeat